MGYRILHKHGTAGPRSRTSYIRFGNNFSSKLEAKKWARKNLNMGGERLRIVPASKVKQTKIHKKLFYVTK